QRVIGEPIVSGLALDESGLWDFDFSTTAKQEPAYFHTEKHSTPPANIQSPLEE
ncbi:hypothetical protein FCV25MIE_01643, partial [Fagus crenata]